MQVTSAESNQRYLTSIAGRKFTYFTSRLTGRVIFQAAGGDNCKGQNQDKSFCCQRHQQQLNDDICCYPYDAAVRQEGARLSVKRDADGVSLYLVKHGWQKV